MTLTVPAGTRLLLELRRTISTRSARPGDSAYLQTTVPVVLGDKTIIPVGSYVQGSVDQINRHGANGRPEIQLRLATLTFANGYTVGIPGTIAFGLGRDYTYYERPDMGGAALAIDAGAPIAGLLIGGFAAGPNKPTPLPTPVSLGPGSPTLPPLPTLPSLGRLNVKGAAIGAGIGAGVGFTALLIELGKKNVVMEAGLSTEMTLQEPLQLQADRVEDAVLHYKPPVIIHTPPIVIHDNQPTGTCYTPDIPGTPDTIIPGTPAMPGIGDSPGTPGTPDTVIPGTPAIPGTPYPC